MKYFFTIIFILIFITFIVSGRATILTSPSTSSTDVQNTISLASSGDTVIVPSGSTNWSSTVTITNGITLLGGGGTNGITTITQGGGANTCIVSVNNITGYWAIVGGGFTFIESYLEYAPNTFIQLRGSNYRFCSNTVDTTVDSTAGIVAFTDSSSSNMLIDNCFSKFSQGNFVSPYGAGYSEWNYGPCWGQNNKLYIENCRGYSTATLYTPDGLVDAYNGASYVVRFCTFTNVDIGGPHGADSSGTTHPSGHSLEYYGNTFYFTGTDPPFWDSWVQIRGGSGLIYSNNLVNYHPYSNHNIIKLQYFRISTTADIANWPMFPASPWDGFEAGGTPFGYPGFEQPGMSGPYSIGSTNSIQTHSPIYAWGITGGTDNGAGIFGIDCDAMQLNRDYYTNAPTYSNGTFTNFAGSPGMSYTPLTYPYPLNNGNNTNNLHSPTGLRISRVL